MKLSEIKPLNEYAKGGINPSNIEQIMDYLNDAEQERIHFVVKNGEGPTAFVYFHQMFPGYYCYILVNSETKNYIGHCTIKNLNDVLQPIETNIDRNFTGNQLAPRLYSFISAKTGKYIINAEQLSAQAEKMWLKIPHKKIYNKNEEKFYELSDPKAGNPSTDIDRNHQTWYFAFKEERKILEDHKYLGENFDYDRFLSGKPGLFLGGKYHNITPMTCDLV